MSEQKSMHTKRTLLVVSLTLFVVAGAGIGLWLVGPPDGFPIEQATPAAGSAYQTTVTRRGNVALSISGAGTVVASQTVDLAFRVSGELAELNVQVGDQVNEGQVLAQLGSLSELALAIENQELAVQAAEQTLQDLQTNGPAVLAQAVLDVAAAEAAYIEAEKNLHQPGDSRCAPSLTQDYYFEYLYAQKRVDEWEGYLADANTGYSDMYILERLAPMRKERDQAYYNWVYCQSYTAEEIRESQAALELAKAELAQARADREALQASQGLDLRAAETAQAELAAARLQLTKAQIDLAGATITAPIAGTVMAVNGSVAETVGTEVFITLAVLDDPQVQVTIDETDLVNFAVGCPVQVTFESLAEKNFVGTVSQVLPALATVDGVGMVQGLIDLEGSGVRLPVGLTASVEVTCQSASSVLYIPAQALYMDGQAKYVYVMDESGRPEKREVTVGIETVASAEIRSGLEEGEAVILSPVEEN